MTTIYQKIKADFISARKNKVQPVINLLSTVIGEIDNEASRSKTGTKEVTDEIAIKVLKSFSKNLDEVIKISSNEAAVLEKATIDSYLPTQMSESFLRSVIATSGFTNMKDIMAYLKANHAGLYDGKMASQIAKEFA